MNLIELIVHDLKHINEREIYLSIPFSETSIISFEKQENYKVFLEINELKRFKSIYLAHGISYKQMCDYLIYYVQTNLRHVDDIILYRLNFEQLLNSLDNYTEYDFIHSEGIANKDSQLYIMRAHPSSYIIPPDLVEFMGVDLVKHLHNMYKNETTDKIIENILYYYDNLNYPDKENLTVLELIDSLETFHEEISINISDYSPHAKVKMLWSPYYDGKIKEKSMGIEDFLDNSGWHDFNNPKILSDWKEDYLDFIEEEGLGSNPILLSYLILHEHIWDSGPPDEWLEDLLNYLKQDYNGKTIPHNMLDRD